MADRLSPRQVSVLEVLQDAARSHATLNTEALVAVVCARRHIAYSTSQDRYIRAVVESLVRLGMVSQRASLVRIRAAGSRALQDAQR